MGLIMIAVALAAAPPAAADAATAWSLAYSGYVSRFCPSWRQRLEALPPDFLPTAQTFDTLWGEGSVRQQAFRAGGLAAEADHRRDARFCEHPLSVHPERGNVLNRLLAPTNRPASRH